METCPHQVLAATLALSQPLNLAPLIRACRDNSNVLPLLKTFNEELVERKCYNDATLSFFLKHFSFNVAVNEKFVDKIIALVSSSF